MDKYNELINARMKTAKYTRRTSSLPFARLLARYLRTDDFMLRLKEAFARKFKSTRNAVHKTKDKSQHLWMIMINTVARTHGETSGLRQKIGRASITSSTDLLHAGLDRLHLIVEKFNLTTISQQQGSIDKVGGQHQADIITDIFDSNAPRLNSSERGTNTFQNGTQHQLGQNQQHHAPNSGVWVSIEAANATGTPDTTDSFLDDTISPIDPIDVVKDSQPLERDFGDAQNQDFIFSGATDIGEPEANRLNEVPSEDSSLFSETTSLSDDEHDLEDLALETDLLNDTTRIAELHRLVEDNFDPDEELSF
jgi:hypothetical protein